MFFIIFPQTIAERKHNEEDGSPPSRTKISVVQSKPINMETEVRGP